VNRKIILLTITVLVLFPSLGAEDSHTYIPSFGWYNPRIMAMGGEVSADPDGFSAFVSNPAGFAGEKVDKSDESDGERKGDFTLLSLQAAMIASPFRAVEMAGGMDDGSDPTAVMLDFVIDQLETNGMGAKADIALAAYSARGWGLGAFLSAGALFPQSDLALATEGTATADMTLEIGYAHVFKTSFADIVVGGDIRPAYRMIVPMTADNIINGVSDITVLPSISGFGVGLDLGATLEWRELTFAAVLRDLGHTRYYMYEVPLSGLGNFSSDVAVDTQYITPMSLTLGVGYEPTIPAVDWLVKTTFVASFKTDLLLNGLPFGIDPLNYYDYTQGSFWKSLHMGMETKWINLIYLRAGLNGGYFTAGTGIDFFIGELNLALFSTETGRTAGQTSQLGASLELAFRW